VPIEKAGLDAIQSGRYPKKWLRPEQGAAVTEIAPWGIAYNEQVLKDRKLDAPKDWPDILSPGFAGQILIPDPSSADAYFQYWNLMLQTYGEPFFAKLRDQKLRIISSGAPAVQSLAAG